MNKFVLYLIVVGLLNVSKLSASFTSEESKENFLSSLQRSLQNDTNDIQFENKNLDVNIYPMKHKKGTYYVRIVGGEKEFELVIK